jgi:hypothetical protein
MVPQQALFSMNDPFIISQARSLAGSLAKQEAANGKEKLTWLYRRLYQRDPTLVELKVGIGFLASAVQSLKQQAPRAWSYGIGPADVEIAADKRFTPFPYFDNKKQTYQLSKALPHPKRGFVRLFAKGGNPGPLDVAIRRWRAPVAGDFRLVANLERPSAKGDTIRGRVIHSREGVLGEWEVKTGIVETRVEKFSVEIGDSIDLIVDANGNASNDTFNWTATISRLGDYQTMPSGEKTVWNSQADFSRPPPHQLRPWEQLAHALMMTNEFLFVD